MRVFLIDGKVPRKWRISWAARCGKTISVGVLPQGVMPESILSPLQETLKNLQIAVGAPSGDYSFLEDFSELRDLGLWINTTMPIDFTKMNLESLAISASRSYRSVIDSQTIKSLYVAGGGVSWLPRAGQLTELALEPISKDRDLSALATQKNLEKLSLTGRGRIDLAGVRSLVSLTSIDLSWFSEVLNAEVLVYLPHLRRIAFSDVKKVDNVRVLHMLRDSGIHVHADGMAPWTRPFHPESRSLLSLIRTGLH